MTILKNEMVVHNPAVAGIGRIRIVRIGVLAKMRQRVVETYDGGIIAATTTITRTNATAVAVIVMQKMMMIVDERTTK